MCQMSWFMCARLVLLASATAVSATAAPPPRAAGPAGWLSALVPAGLVDLIELQVDEVAHDETTFSLVVLKTDDSNTLWNPLAGLPALPTASPAVHHEPHHLLTREQPPGSGWRAQLAKTHPDHPLAAGAGPTPTNHPTARLGGHPRDPNQCPNATIDAAVQQAGLLSVKWFGATGDGSGDDAPAVRRAMNMTTYCGGCVFFPPGTYKFNTTLQIGRGCFKGSDGHGAVDGSSPPQVNIYGPAEGPAIYLNKAEDVLIQDLAFHGQITAVYIGDAAGIRFVNVGAEAGGDADGVNATVEGCNATACNVVLGSVSAAMVIENSFWLWFERCAFTDQTNSGKCLHPYKKPCDW